MGTRIEEVVANQTSFTDRYPELTAAKTVKTISSERDSFLLIAAIVLVCSTALIVSIFLGFPVELVAVGFMSLLFSFPVALSFCRNRLFEDPMALVGMSFLFYYSASSFGAFQARMHSRDGFWPSIYLIALCFVTIVVSYRAGANQTRKLAMRLPQFRLDFRSRRVLLSAAVLLTLGCYALEHRLNISGASIFSFSEGFIPNALEPYKLSGTMWMVPFLISPVIGIFFLFSFARARKSIQWTIVSILLLVFFLYTLSKLGSRSRLLTAALGAALIYHFQFRRIRRTGVVILLATMLSALVSYVQVRSILFSGTGAEISDTLSSFETADYLSSHGDSVVFRAMMDIVESYPDKHDYLWGETLITPITNWIPRVLWPGKPDSGAAVYTSLYAPEFWERGGTSTPGLVGELYMNAGTLGVILGAILIGLLAGLIKNYLDIGLMNTSTILLYISSVIALLVFARGDFAFWGMMIIGNTILICLGLLIAGGRIGQHS